MIFFLYRLNSECWICWRGGNGRAKILPKVFSFWIFLQIFLIINIAFIADQGIFKDGDVLLSYGKMMRPKGEAIQLGKMSHVLLEATKLLISGWWNFYMRHFCIFRQFFAQSKFIFVLFILVTKDWRQEKMTEFHSDIWIWPRCSVYFLRLTSLRLFFFYTFFTSAS